MVTVNIFFFFFKGQSYLTSEQYSALSKLSQQLFLLFNINLERGKLPSHYNSETLHLSVQNDLKE